MFEKEIKLFNSILGTLRSQTNSNETPLIELKENNINPDEIGKSISAVANACILEKADSGYIVFGIENSTLQEKGVNFDPFNLKALGQQDMEMYLRQMLVAGDFRFIPFKKEDKNFLLIEIFRALGSQLTIKTSLMFVLVKIHLLLKIIQILSKKYGLVFNRVISGKNKQSPT